MRMRRAAVPVFAILLTLSAFAQTAPPAQSPPSNWPTAHFAASKDPSVQKACQVLNDMLRKLGGMAYLNVRTMETQGRAYSFYHGQPNSMSVLYWRFWEWPDKERIEFSKQRDIVELLVGDKGYEITYKGTAEQDPKDLEQALRSREHSLESVIRKWLPAEGTTILYSGTAMVERNLADQVTVLNATNDSVTLSIDRQSHLPSKVSYSWRDPADRQFDDASVVFSNYKLVQGVQTPFSIVHYSNGDMASQRFITSVTYNTELAPTLFETKGLTYKQDKPPAK